MKSLRLAPMVALALPLICAAQFDSGSSAAAPTPAWESFKYPKAKTMTLSFRNANIDMVLEAFSKASGITIIKDPGVKDALTLTTPKPVKLGEAFSILNIALKQRNYELRKEGNVLVAGPKREQAPSFDPSMLAGMNQNKPEIRVQKIKFANASEVSRVINEVFAMEAGAAAGGNPFSGMNFGGSRFGGRGGRGGFNPMAMLQGMVGSQPGDPNDIVRASSDDYSNSVIVLANKDKHIQVNDLVKEIDKPSDAPQNTKVYGLQYSNAQDMQTVIQNTLTSNQPTGRGGRTTNQQQGGGGFGFFGGFGQQQQRNAQVGIDTRSNSLVVTTTEENHAIVKRVVEELDRDLPVEATTFVVPLANARADDVATLLQNAYGTRQGANRNNQNRANTSSRSTTTTNNRNAQPRNLQGRTGGPELSAATNPDGLDVALQDPAATEGDLRTQFFFGFGQNQNQNRSTQQQLARGADGRLTNIRDLTGQVTVIPDNNTNSVIVIADPGNYKLLQSVIDQLDRIPEQVMIETIIVEASLTKENKLGVEWSLAQAKAFGQSGVTGNVGAGFGLQASNPSGFKYSLTGGNLTAFMTALQTDDKFQVLSTPRIFTTNNVEAEINISQSVPYVLSSRTDSNGNVTYNYAFQDVGIVLNVTPRITSNGYVTLDVVQTANDLQGFTSFNAPIVNQRQAQTTVTVKDGETMILGGIIRKTITSKVSKLPVLGDIPFLGNLFKSTSHQDAKTELMVLLTPRVVRTTEDARRLREEQESQYTRSLTDSSKKPKDAGAAPPAKGTGKGGG